MLSFNGLALRRSATLLFEAVDLKVYPGQKLGITGANGCGKSSLFALIRGDLGADQGDFSMPQQWALAWVEQETVLSNRIAVEYVIDGDAELRPFPLLHSGSTGGRWDELIVLALVVSFFLALGAYGYYSGRAKKKRRENNRRKAQRRT